MNGATTLERDQVARAAELPPGGPLLELRDIQKRFSPPADWIQKLAVRAKIAPIGEPA